MQVNDLIFKELIKRGYSLDGKTRIWNIADSKLWYLTPEQAQGFLDLEQGEDYKKDVIQKEIDLIKFNINEVLKKIGNKPVNIIDLGCGDGKKAVLFVENLKGKIKLRYCPIDISSYMVEKALDKIKKINAGEVVKFQWNISDFENLENVANLLRMSDYKSNLFLLLGNTLGNFEINELLYEIGSSMKKGDFLLIGNGLDNRHYDDIVKSYNDPTFDDWLMNIIGQLGLEKKDVKFGVRFKNSRVEMYYTILNDRKISFQDKNVYFAKGDQILVCVSYKYDEYDFRHFMRLYFGDVKVYVSKDKSYALAMCQK
ncbi:MAG: L-histidine N(alpha)-methyltransferase [Nanoarchaeota archaeon]